jgi:Ala-tRNA(Pro) deacylase
MPISKKLRDFLTKNKISFEAMQHSVAYTAQEIAQAQHVPGNETIKSVIVKVDGKCVMCVLPATYKIDLEKLKKVLNGKTLQLAGEEDLSKLFPDYELGAEPPFGNLYGLDVYVDSSLQNNETVVFNAGTHTDTVRLAFSDFTKLAKPQFADIGKHV